MCTSPPTREPAPEGAGHGPRKEQIKAPEKVHLSKEERANLSDAQFKTLVIRILTEMAEYGHKIEEKVKTTKIEIKGTVTGRKQGLK